MSCLFYCCTIICGLIIFLPIFTSPLWLYLQSLNQRFHHWWQMFNITCFFFFLIEWQIVYLFVHAKFLFRPTHHSRSHYPLIDLPVTLIKYVAQTSCCSSPLSPLFFFFTSSALCWCIVVVSFIWFCSFLLMSMVLLGPGLRPRVGAEPTDPSERTGS